MPVAVTEPSGPAYLSLPRTGTINHRRYPEMRKWWLTIAADGNPQDDSDSGNKHGGGGSDEGGNTNDGQGPADGR